MFGARRTPLAWSLLVHDKTRMCLSVLGVAFAVFLMFIEMGFLNGVFDSQTLLADYFNADLVVAHRFREAVIPPRVVLRQRLEDALRLDGVAAVYPLYFSLRSEWKANGQLHWLATVGIDPEDPALDLPELAKYRDALRQPGTALVDRRLRKAALGVIRPGMEGELNHRRLRLVGDFAMGPDFVVDGRLIMSDRNFVTYFPDPVTGGPNFDRMEMGLVRLVPGADAEAVCRQLQSLMPADVRVFTKQGLMEMEKWFFGKVQPVGLIFGLGMFVGFVIGVTICYQILFTEVNDHQAEFATLKAIGYSNPYLVGVVLRESLCLALLAFLPGLLGAFLTYATLEEATGITMRLTFDRAAVVFVLTVVMSLASAMLALRKVMASDPAEVF
jgi:putative ABC transport system permease protein